ncbi:hypothetical protein PtrEW4_011861, partial [Pyrenophora tritici-repentis]
HQAGLIVGISANTMSYAQQTHPCVSTSNTQIFGPIFAVVYVQAGTDTAVEEPVL